MEQRVSLVTLGVADVGRARMFYERLGWRGQEVEETVFFQAGGMALVLWARDKLAADAGLDAGTAGGFGGVALAHNVRSRAEVDALLAAAADAGAEMTQAARDTFYGGYAGYFRDPDGHLWEVAWNPGFPPRPGWLAHPARLRPVASHSREESVVPAPVRFGLAGYGLGGRYFHAPLIASAANCEFLGVVTTSPERRNQVATDLKLPVFADLDELARAGAEAVAISTPAATHVALTQQALRLGLAVVCDKPFALDVGSARATVELAEQLGVPLTVYQNRRWDSDFLTLRQLLGQGALGTLTAFESRFERFRPQQNPPAAGGGTLLDFGSHLADQALRIAGPVTSVYAEMHYPDDASGLDDDVFIALTHESGVRSHLWGSWRQGAPGPRFRAAGTEGAYVIQDVDGQEAQLRSGASPASMGGHWGTEPPERWGHLLRGDATEPVPSVNGAWNLFYPAFAEAVRGTRPVPVDPWDAVATAAVLDAARTSARTAQAVSPAQPGQTG